MNSIEWRLSTEDTVTHMHAIWTFENETAARMWLAELDTTRYLNPKLERRTVTTSVWEAIDQ